MFAEWDTFIECKQCPGFVCDQNEVSGVVVA